jgi:hypothetical protein
MSELSFLDKDTRIKDSALQEANSRGHGARYENEWTTRSRSMLRHEHNDIGCRRRTNAGIQLVP